MVRTVQFGLWPAAGVSTLTWFPHRPPLCVFLLYQHGGMARLEALATWRAEGT
jgi:hypothetical protein